MVPPLSSRLTRQVLAAIIVGHPFTHPPSPLFGGFSVDSLLQILSSIPSLLLLPPRSAARQPLSLTPRHRSPLRPTHPPTRHLTHPLTHLSLLFYSWAHTHCLFPPNPLTCRSMARLLAHCPSLSSLWHFLKHNKSILTTATLTDVIKTLGQRGLAREALAAFHRMGQLHCKPDVQCCNTTIAALCRVGHFKKARFLLVQMELPGSRCPPDNYTYTILIGFYCKRSMQTGCKKAIRRRIWEANHMFRHMICRGHDPDLVTYNCLIDGLCKTYRIGRAHEVFDEMLVKGCLPNKVTYNSFVRYYSVVNEVDKAIEMMRMMVMKGHGVPTCSSYTPVIHSLCESGRVKEAAEFLKEMVGAGSTPREFTYKLVCDALRSAGEEGLSMDLRRKIEGFIEERYRRVMQVKPVMSERSRFVREDDV